MPPLNFARVARLAAFFLAASLSFPSLASPSEDANAAYRNGDYTTALRLWGELAQQGDATAQSLLGVMYRDGRGVPRDNQRAVEWFRKAAEQGNARAQNNLGVMYENGRGGLPKDDKQAVEWYRKASEQGDAFGQNNLGVMYRYGRGGLPPDENQAVELFRRAAEQGNALGQANLGSMYAVGGGGLPQDDGEAVKWIRKAAEQGNALGQNALGVMYQKGRGGLPQDDNQAVEWYRKAAEQGNANGQANLGVMYRDGRGVAQSRAEAERWLKKAAEQGNAGAQDNLARLDRAGRNVPRDDQQAIATYALLSLIGNQLTVVTTTSESVRGISGTKKEVLPLKDGSLDLAALKSTDAAVRRVLPGASVLMLQATDAKFYATQTRWESDNSIDVSELVSMLGRNIGSGAPDHLILICSHRGPIRMRYTGGSIYNSSAAGLGLYLNTWQVTARDDTQAQGKGFLVPFANFRMVLIDLHAMVVESQEYSSTGELVSAAYADDGNPWHALSDQAKADRLRSLLTEEIEQMTPRLLAKTHR